MIILCTILSARRGHTRIYFHLRDHSLFYFVASILFIILLHDTYFYWTHRLMHWKRIFRYVHRVHHLSHNPTPLAAFAFHPLEAVIEAGIMPLVAWVIPAHPLALAISGLYMILMNVMGHLGYELFPKSFVRNKWLNWQNTSTHHNMHHHYSKHNYGLYFNWWDRLMGTNHPRYREEFRGREGSHPSFTEERKLFTEKVD
jgi:sterol desaturase/sphingolipid hydroxylase (fatty acid hydroxylase superfamily)